MSWKDFWWCCKTLLLIILVVICSYLFARYISIKLDDETITYPVEETKIIDSITKDNIRLDVEINYLDSIKNVRIDEVKTINNDSTIKLFYELIRR